MAKSKIDLPIQLIFRRTLLPSAPRVYAVLKYSKPGKRLKSVDASYGL
jgi:hypothetical protein